MNFLHGWEPPPEPIPATLPKDFHEELGRVLSRGRQNTCEGIWHTPKISQKFAGEWNFGL